MQKLMITH